MEKIKEELLILFDDMLSQTGSFKKKTYKGIFEQAYEKHKGVVSDILALCEGKTDEEREKITDELADVLPDHAKHFVLCGMVSNKVLIVRCFDVALTVGKSKSE